MAQSILANKKTLSRENTSLWPGIIWLEKIYKVFSFFLPKTNCRIIAKKIIKAANKATKNSKKKIAARKDSSP